MAARGPQAASPGGCGTGADLSLSPSCSCPCSADVTRFPRPAALTQAALGRGGCWGVFRHRCAQLRGLSPCSQGLCPQQPAWYLGDAAMLAALAAPCTDFLCIYHPGAQLRLSHPRWSAHGPLPKSPRECPQIVPCPCIQPPMAMSCHWGGCPVLGAQSSFFPRLHSDASIMLPQFPHQVCEPGVSSPGIPRKAEDASAPACGPGESGAPRFGAEQGVWGFGAPQHPPHCRCITRPLWVGGLASALAPGSLPASSSWPKLVPVQREGPGRAAPGPG